MVVTVLVITLVVGLVNALALYWQKRESELHGRKIFCLIGQDCEAVVLSPYGTTLGVENELLGVAYYVGSLVLLALFTWADSYFALGLLAFAALAASLFSIYLIVLQVFVLRKYCSWCLLAIVLNFVILGLTIVL